MKKLLDFLLQKPFAEMAQALMKNEKFQGKLKKFLGAISKPEQSMMIFYMGVENLMALSTPKLHASLKVACCRRITQV